VATIRDVARLAGVSPSTVSHVLNGTAPISEETKQLVMRAVRQLGYVPRSLQKNWGERRRVVILRKVSWIRSRDGDQILLDDLAEPIYLAAYRFFKEKGYESWIFPYEDDNELNRITAEQLVGFAGALVVSDTVQAYSEFPDLALPTMLAYCSAKSRPYLSVVPDDYRGGYDATRHLIELGHRRIAYINGPADWIASKERLQGYLAALQEAGLTPDPKLIERGDWSMESGKEATERLLSRTRFTAVFYANDIMAFGGLQILKKRGLSVPGDVAVVGFDNRAIACWCDPPLTTVQLPLENIGRRAALELIRLIEEHGEVSTSLYRIQEHCPLVIRASCGGGTAVRAASSSTGASS